MTAPDLAAAAAPRSDQLNADDLIGGPRTVTITEVRRGNSEQPVEIVTEEFGPSRPYKPGKSMIRVLLATWGPEASTYTGRKLMLYRDPEITFGRDKVGGIRISAMSHIDKRMSIPLTVTRGRRAPFVVEPLPAGPQLITDDQADDFARRILEAATIDALNTIAADLKTWDLGGHRQRLGTAWTARKNEIEQPVQGAIDDQEQAS
ncbi:hypothetical protein FK268_23105 [Tsukamurella sputi]|uniref:Uncharacterized protein n=3 Tax=Tsukamurella TaxID=2060 RepID=A0A5C5RFK9_9ACTN|nr:hypothetical protein [Tsukamurella conjunctivitidis]TWS21726.1 hypothetical protein FK268_23105 [Tsukamurella sputi]TWS25568.1 hypothetical protein FK530_22885 [Tsukamurella conjunctivitidis]